MGFLSFLEQPLFPLEVESSPAVVACKEKPNELTGPLTWRCVTGEVVSPVVTFRTLASLGSAFLLPTLSILLMGIE